MTLKLKDNTVLSIQEANHDLVLRYTNKDLALLQKEGFIVFPLDLGDSEDLDNNRCIFETFNSQTRTGNIVGKIRDRNSGIDINSRFYNSSNEQDYFIHYMLQKVLNYNIISLQTQSSDEDSYYDLLVYLFPAYLNQAMRKGIYKEYVKKSFNDSNVKGSIDVPNHIRGNIPFQGKVAYKTREFSYDNPVVQLIRHTIDKIERDYSGRLIFDDLTREYIRDIKNVTSGYRLNDKTKVISYNMSHPIRHGFYEEYLALQKLCLHILNDEKSGFGTSEELVNGIIIDVAWLWEAYLNTVIGNLFIHSDNRKKINGIEVYQGDRRTMAYPDFFKVGEIVLDAKYKDMENSSDFIRREDRYQLISYMYLLNTKSAGIIYPTSDLLKCLSVKRLNAKNDLLFSLSFSVPQSCMNSDDFSQEIEFSEESLISSIINMKGIFLWILKKYS